MKEIKVFKVNSRQHRFILVETNLSSNRDTDLIKFVTTPAKNKLESLQPPGGRVSQPNVNTGRICPEVQPLTLLIDLYTVPFNNFKCTVF